MSMSLNPERHNFNVWRGTTFRRVLEVWHDDAETNPYDFTGYAGLMNIRDRRGGTIIGTISASFSGNEITLVATSGVTALWDWDQGVYELQLTAPNGDVDILLFGIVLVRDVS